MKIAINLKPNTFLSFKNAVSKAFPKWKVKQHAPLIYVNRTVAGAMLFSLVDYQFSEAEVERLNQIAAQAIPADEPPSKYMPKYMSREQVRKARTTQQVVRRKKIKAMADAFG